MLKEEEEEEGERFEIIKTKLKCCGNGQTLL